MYVGGSIEYDYVFISVSSHETKNGFVTLEQALYIYIGSGSSSHVAPACFNRSP